MSDVKCPERLYAFDTPSRNYLNYSHSPSSPSPDSINDDPLPSSQDQIDSHPSLADDLPPTDDFLAGAAEVDPTANASSPSSSLSLLSLSRDEKEQATRGHRKVISIHAPNPSHLFWVPAAQHPEIAPAEFEKFLRAGAIAKRERASLRRRSSILSVSFTANDAAKQDSEDIAEGEPQHPQQALEISNTRLIGDQGLVDAESEAQRKTRLRRSISLDTAKAAEVQLRLPDFLVFDRNSSPLDQSRVLVPRADRPSLLRRGARTKFHRNSAITPSSSQQQIDRHRQAESMPPIPFDKSNFGGVTLSDAAPPPPHSSLPPSPESLSNTTSAATITDSLSTRPSSLSPPRPELQRRASAEELSRLQHQQHGDFHSFTAQTEAPLPSPSPAPITPPPPASQAPPTTTVPVIIKQQAPEIPPLGSSERVERKSSSWSWSFRKSKSEQLRHQESTAPRNSAPSSLTAGRKSPEPRPSVSTDSGGGKLFGLSSLFSRKSSPSKAQSTSYSSTAVPKDFQLNKINQNRLPIHIERAVYRLSHTKLANPRRPLHEQVLISNLMFWYLSIVSPSQPVPNGSNGGGGGRVVDSGRKFIHAGKKGRRRPSSQQQKVSKGGGAPPQEQNNNATLHLYMSNNASTGFVIPENYLRPQTRPKHRKPSLSDSDDDEDDQISDSSSSSSSSGSDEDGDDEPSKGVLATMAGRKSKSRQQKLTKSKKASSSLPKHTHSVTKTKGGGGDDDIPLAMCRKTKT